MTQRQERPRFRPWQRILGVVAAVAVLAGCSRSSEVGQVEQLVPGSIEPNFWWDGSGFEVAVTNELGKDALSDQIVRLDWRNGERTPGPTVLFVDSCIPQPNNEFSVIVSADSEEASIVDGSAVVSVESAPGSALPPSTPMRPSPECGHGDVSAQFRAADFPQGGVVVARYATDDGHKYEARFEIDPPEAGYYAGRVMGRALQPPER